MGARVVHAAWLIVSAEDDDSPLPDGGLLVESGRVLRVLRNRGAVRRASAHAAATLALEGHVLTPGLVNAHAHLELGDLAGKLAGADGMVAWIRSLMAARAKRTTWDDREAVRRGSQRALATGTTLVADVDSTGASVATPVRGLRKTIFREVLDAGEEERTAAAFERLRRALPERARVREGLSPHAPHTTSDALLERAGELARRRDLSVQVHWAETAEESEWCLTGRGPFAALLARPPGRPGLDRLEAAGLLGPRTSLVHGNHPARGELERIAASGATVVHCPGSHRFFERGDFPWQRYRSAGVRLALGTDSLASNLDLSMLREMALLRESAPELDPREVFAMATCNGAQAVSWPQAGTLVPGAPADMAAFRIEADSAETVWERLTGARPDLRGIWIAGRRVGLDFGLRPVVGKGEELA